MFLSYLMGCSAVDPDRLADWPEVRVACCRSNPAEPPWFTRTPLGNRALTGYHLYFHLFVLSALHAVCGIAPAAFSLSMELRILAFAVLFWVAEDDLWFMLNPRHGWRRFNRSRARWHAASWWWVMPRDYWLFTPAGVALYLFGWRV